jgi:predicted nucleotidyltransferase
LPLFFGHTDERFYQRRVIQTVGLGSGTVQRDLARLARAGVLTRTVEGRQVYFQADRRCPVFEELRALVRKTFGVTQVLKHALVAIADRVRVAFVFGSIAAGKETPASDLDLLVVGDDIFLDDVVAAITQAQRDLGREINPSVYPTEEFCRKLAERQHFLSSVAAGPKVFLIGDERDLTRLAKIRMPQRAQNKPPGNRRSVRRR